ncbi:hypothetical protein ACOMHN_016766 [Nucella lapillus]
MGYPNHWCHCHMLQDDSREEELLGDGEMSLSQWLGDEVAITGDEIAITGDEIPITRDKISITGDEIDLTDEDLAEITNHMLQDDSREEELLGDGEMSLSRWLGDEIAITGDEVAITGDEIAITGDEISITGDEIPITGDEIPITGDEISITGDEIPITRDEITITGDEISITGDEIDLTDEDLTEIANQMFANCPPSPSLFPTQAQLPTQAPAPGKRSWIYPLSTPPTVIDYRDPSCSPRIYNGPVVTDL